MQNGLGLANTTIPSIQKHDIKAISDELVLDLLKTLGQISDINKNTELSQSLDQDESLFNDSSSLFDISLQSDDISPVNDVENIKSKNSELRKIVKKAVLNYKQTSKAFLSRSILESEKKNQLLSELDRIKQVLFTLSQDDHELIQKIHTQVDSVQAEIHNSLQMLDLELNLPDSDVLTQKLQDLDQSLEKITFEEEKKNQSCHCIVF